jgi:hypothetical protein
MAIIVTRDDEGIHDRQETVAAMTDQILQGWLPQTRE